MSVTFSPQQIAERHGIDRAKVLRWIDAGDLRAINVASNPNGRPRWRIPEEALAEFEQRRANPAAVPVQRRATPTGIVRNFR